MQPDGDGGDQGKKDAKAGLPAFGSLVFAKVMPETCRWCRRILVVESMKSTPWLRVCRVCDRADREKRALDVPDPIPEAA